jgi:hypothetical protein
MILNLIAIFIEFATGVSANIINLQLIINVIIGIISHFIHKKMPNYYEAENKDDT